MKQETIPISKKQQKLDEFSRAITKVDVEISIAEKQLEKLKEKQKQLVLHYRECLKIDERSMEELLTRSE
jgi:hypothetical protein